MAPGTNPSPPAALRVSRLRCSRRDQPGGGLRVEDRTLPIDHRLSAIWTCSTLTTCEPPFFRRRSVSACAV
jgi:hypothetical protein